MCGDFLCYKDICFSGFGEVFNVGSCVNCLFDDREG